MLFFSESNDLFSEGADKSNHIVVVTSVDVDNNTYEITEAMPKELLRKERTEAEVLNEYGVFKIYRNKNRHTVRPIPIVLIQRAREAENQITDKTAKML